MGAWGWTARAWEIWCCHPPDDTQRQRMARRLLEGKGRHEHGKGRHDGYTAARDGAALQQWTARWHDGYTTARDGAALRRWGAVTAPRRRGKAQAWQGMARQQHDGKGRAAFVRGESDLTSFRTMIRDKQTRHKLLIRATLPIFSQRAQKENHKNEL